MQRCRWFLLILVLGSTSCDSSVEPVTLSAQPEAGNRIDIIFDGALYSFSDFVAVEQDQQRIAIHAYNAESRGIIIELFQFDGPGTYFISPVIARRANVQFHVTRNDVYTALQARGENINITESTASAIAGTFRIHAVRYNHSVIMEGSFRCTFE